MCLVVKVIAVIRCEYAVLSSVSETPLAEPDVRNPFGVAEVEASLEVVRGIILIIEHLQEPQYFVRSAVTNHPRCYPRPGTNTMAAGHLDCTWKDPQCT